MSGNLSRRCRQVRKHCAALPYSEARIPADALCVQWKSHFSLFVPQWLWQTTRLHSGHCFKLFPIVSLFTSQETFSEFTRQAQEIDAKGLLSLKYCRAVAYSHEKVADRLKCSHVHARDSIRP